MVKVTVKTLDSKIHLFDVPAEMTVKEFKDHIAASVNLGAEVQRFILKGRVLQDEKIISDYDIVESTIHLLQRAPETGEPSAPPLSSSSTQAPPRVAATRPGQTLSAHIDQMDLDEEDDISHNDFLKHIPEDWIGTIQLDVRRQLGMPAQLPFSDGFVRLFTRSSNS